MIPYEDLVAALTTWRARQGLPTGPSNFLGEPVAMDYQVAAAEEIVEDLDVLGAEVVEEYGYDEASEPLYDDGSQAGDASTETPAAQVYDDSDSYSADGYAEVDSAGEIGGGYAAVDTAQQYAVDGYSDASVEVDDEATAIGGLPPAGPALAFDSFAEPAPLDAVDAIIDVDVEDDGPFEAPFEEGPASWPGAVEASSVEVEEMDESDVLEEDDIQVSASGEIGGGADGTIDLEPDLDADSDMSADSHPSAPQIGGFDEDDEVATAIADPMLDAAGAAPPPLAPPPLTDDPALDELDGAMAVSFDDDPNDA